MVDLQTVQIGQTGVPILWILFYNPDFFIDPRHVPEWTCAREIRHIPEVIVIVLQGLLAHKDIPAAGEGAEHKGCRTGLAELELDGIAVADIDLAHRREQRSAWDADAFRRPDNPRIGGFDILRRERWPGGLIGPCPAARERGAHHYTTCSDPHRRQKHTSVHY